MFDIMRFEVPEDELVEWNCVQVFIKVKFLIICVKMWQKIYAYVVINLYSYLRLKITYFIG